MRRGEGGEGVEERRGRGRREMGGEEMEELGGEGREEREGEERSDEMQLYSEGSEGPVSI